MEGKRPVFGNISDFLKKFASFEPSDVLVRKTAQDALQDLLGVSLMKTDITYRQGVLRVRCSSIMKQEIQLQKKHLLETINQKVPNIEVVDIV